MQPTILKSIPLADLFFSLSTSVKDERAKVIVCQSQASFIRRLLTDTSPSHPLLQPTINLLSTTTKIQLDFCESVPVLRAHLATLKCNGVSEVYIVNLLRLHKHTPAFSAQGLSRTFASISDACARLAARIYVFEPLEENVSPGDAREAPEEGAIDAAAGNDDDDDPWAQHVPILGSTGRFASQRGWVGRTVGVRRIAGRWCAFEQGHGGPDAMVAE